MKLPLPIYYPTALLFHERRLLNGCSSQRGPTAVQKRKFSRRPIGHWTNPCGSPEVQEMPNKHQGVRSQPAVPPAAVEWKIFFTRFPGIAFFLLHHCLLQPLLHCCRKGIYSWNDKIILFLLQSNSKRGVHFSCRGLASFSI